MQTFTEQTKDELTKEITFQIIASMPNIPMYYCHVNSNEVHAIAQKIRKIIDDVLRYKEIVSESIGCYKPVFRWEANQEPFSTKQAERQNKMLEPPISRFKGFID